MPGRERSFLFQSDGFTIVEILVAVAVTSILGMGLWFALSHAGRLLGKASTVHRNSRQVLFLNDAVTREVGRVRIPFWEGMSLVDGHDEPKTLRLPFVDGARSRELSIEYVGDRVRLSRIEGDAETVVASFGPFTSVKWEWVEEMPGRVSGFLLSVQMEGSARAVSLFVPTPSHPFLVERLE